MKKIKGAHITNHILQCHVYWINNTHLKVYVESTPPSRQQSMIHLVKTSFSYLIFSSMFMNY